MKKYLKITIISLIAILFVSVHSVYALDNLQNEIDSLKNGTITMDKNLEENITIDKGMNITLDLNGYTLTGYITVKGEILIKSSKESGLIEGNLEKDKAAIYSDGGKVTLESGKITNPKGYGIYALNGGYAIVNGGTIETCYSGLTGNNTTGTMYLYVNGGTITAKYGPAIYMPGPVSLDITNGTLNGGISLRMGIVNIKGGTINAITSDIDMPSEYYAFNGNAWLPDALYVFGGTYDSKDDTNKLELNITGGTFNTKNNLGSAVAIYDLGKVAQEMVINISDKAKLKTTSTTRLAYDVLNLADLKVNYPKEGYNNVSYLGKTKTNITGGIYSSSVSKYLTSYYTEVKENNLYKVTTKEFEVKAPEINGNEVVKEINTGLKNSKEVKNIFTDSLKDSKINIEGIEPIIDVDIKNNVENVEEKVKTSINETINKLGKNVKLANLFEISIKVKNKADSTYLGELEELTDKVQFIVAIPDDLLVASKGYERKFYIIRYHNNESEVIPATLKDNMLSFSSDKFSTYALAYEDKNTKEEANPNTSDNILVFLSLATLALVGSIKVYKKLHN